MGDQYRESFSRNIGFITEAEQAVLKGSTVAIAGMGGVGAGGDRITSGQGDNAPR